jgi:segregation and condensation protein A
LSKSNKDNIEDGINQTLEKIKNYINPFYFEDYWGETKKEKSEFLLYLLFLEKNGKIRMDQDDPYDDIMVTKLF